MTLSYIADCVIPAALLVLPKAMDSDEARAMLVAIGLQESGFLHRRQIGGPARGFWQFEAGGVNGVLRHQATKDIIAPLIAEMRYTQAQCYAALEHNDILAAIFARLLLWTLPDPLPSDAADGWAQYLDAWRPGKPHRLTWDGHYERAWEMV